MALPITTWATMINSSGGRDDVIRVRWAMALNTIGPVNGAAGTPIRRASG